MKNKKKMENNNLIVMDGQFVDNSLEVKELDPEFSKLVDEHFWELV